MKHLPWILACVGGAIGVVLAAAQREGSFIAGICAAGGYIIGAVIKALVNRSADEGARQQGTE